MEVAVVLVTLFCYGLVVFLWWYFGTPIYLFTLWSGHIGALAAPLWAYLYAVDYAADLSVLQTLFGHTLFWPIFLASAWFYSLPALLVFGLYRSNWWFPNYLSVVLTYGVFLFYHLIIELLGLRMAIWSYAAAGLPLGLSHALLSAIMGALVSLGLLYVLLLVYRFGWLNMLLALLPTTLLLSLLIHGLLGAPLWIARLLTAQTWAVSLGLASTAILLVWAAHIVCSGMERVD